jgi:hypothetical protein
MCGLRLSRLQLGTMKAFAVEITLLWRFRSTGGGSQGRPSSFLDGPFQCRPFVTSGNSRLAGTRTPDDQESLSMNTASPKQE